MSPDIVRRLLASLRYGVINGSDDERAIFASQVWEAINCINSHAAQIERLRAALAHELDLRDRHIESLEARIKELSDLNEALMENGNDLRTRCQKAETRIKELEGMIKQLGSLAFMADYTPLDQIIAHFMSWGQSNYEYTSRLEVAFLRSNAAMRYYQEGNRGPWPQLGEKFKEPYQEKAREELERIRNGE